MKIADFKIKIKGFDFCDEDNGFVTAGLYRDDDKQLFFCIPTQMHGALSSQLEAYVHNANYSEFGSLIQAKDARYNSTDAEIDFAKSQFITFIIRNSSCIHFYIDIVSITYASTNSQNTSSFLLNHAGFEIIKNYYNLSFSSGEEYRMGEIKKDYSFIINNSTFFPRFHFGWHESVSEPEISIKKVPFIKSRNFDEDNVLNDFNCLLQILRIYYNVDLDYTEICIHLQSKTRIIYKSSNKTYNYIIEPLSRGILKTPQDIESFISSVDTKQMLSYLESIKNIIDSKLTSSLLNGKTRFLVLYNVFENLQNIKQKQRGSRQNKDEFTNIENIQNKFESLLNDILPLVDEKEKADFQKKWTTSCPKYKPAISVTADFLSESGLDVSKIDELIKEYTSNKYKNLVKLRDDITHGKSTFDGVDFDKVNRLLSLITILLLLNVIGLKNYSLDTFKDSQIYNPPDLPSLQEVTS